MKSLAWNDEEGADLGFEVWIYFWVVRCVAVGFSTVCEVGVDVGKRDVLYLLGISKDPYRLHACNESIN